MKCPKCKNENIIKRGRSKPEIEAKRYSVSNAKTTRSYLQKEISCLNTKKKNHT